MRCRYMPSFRFIYPGSMCIPCACCSDETIASSCLVQIAVDDLYSERGLPRGTALRRKVDAGRSRNSLDSYAVPIGLIAHLPLKSAALFFRRSLCHILMRLSHKQRHVRLVYDFRTVAGLVHTAHSLTQVLRQHRLDVRHIFRPA